MDKRVKWLYLWFLKGVDINIKYIPYLTLIDPDKYIKELIKNMTKDYGNE
jgi:hypothetical protein